jgi:hypothetical protein
MKYKKRREEIHAVEFRLDEQVIQDLQVFTGGALMRWGKQHLPTEGPWAYVRTLDDQRTVFVVLEGQYIAKRADGSLFGLTKEELERDFEKA